MKVDVNLVVLVPKTKFIQSFRIRIHHRSFCVPSFSCWAHEKQQILASGELFMRLIRILLLRREKCVRVPGEFSTLLEINMADVVLDIGYVRVGWRRTIRERRS